MKRFLFAIAAAAVAGIVVCKLAKSEKFDQFVKSVTPLPNESEQDWRKRIANLGGTWVKSLA